MTKRLFNEDPYLRTWKTEVKDIIEKEGKILVVLEETAFYPEGGGQPSDQGTIDDIEVEYVFEEEGEVYHQMKAKPSTGKVQCSLDVDRRFDYMQQHTGQHLISAMFYRLYQGETSSFHLGEEYVNIDISLSDISQEMVKHVEENANLAIYRNLPVKTYYVEKDRLHEIPLRKQPKVDEDIRIVEIDEVDYSPCCGTHVKNIGEIGIVKIIKTEKYKGVTRVYFKCGRRALWDYENKHDLVTNTMKLLTAGEHEIVDRIKSMDFEAKERAKELKVLREKIAAFEAKELVDSSEGDILLKQFEDKSFEETQSLARAVLQLKDHILIFVSSKEHKLLFTHGGNFPVHCGKLFKESIAEFHGKGGGGDKQAQASFPDKESLMAFAAFLKEKL